MFIKSKFFRLLPATIFVAFLLLCVKVVGLVRDTESIFIASVEAQTPEKPSNVSTEKPENLPEQGATKKEDEKKSEEKKSDDKKSEEKKEEKNENPNVSKKIEATTEQRFTAVEVELLQSLAKRREELARWENNIQIKEMALEATQKRIEDKIRQIEAMKKQVATLLSQYNTQEDAKIRSLVKIYESMKPAEAARIFDEVEMPILLLVIDTMSEKKAAPILAAMNPKKAKQLTVELANERKINTKITSGVESQLDSNANVPETETNAPAQPAPVAAPEPAKPAQEEKPKEEKPKEETKPASEEAPQEKPKSE